MKDQTSEVGAGISDAEVEAEIFRLIKAHEDRPHQIRKAVRAQMQGIPREQVRRALDSLSQREIVC